MLRNVVARTLWASQCHARGLPKREMRPNVWALDIASKLTVATAGGKALPLQRSFHTCLMACKAEDRKTMLASMPKRIEGTEGEVAVEIDANVRGFGVVYPDENTPDQLFDGVRFDDLPIVHVKISKNNSIMTLSDSKGKLQLLRSGGIEGFKNSRKGTNVAAQATGISLATRAVGRGYKNVRVKVKGLGPGRMSGVKGLAMGGLNVVCISDVTIINWNNSPRPPKARKL